jgi:hypothetical protein
MSGKYFPNNYESYKNAPDDAFIPHTFEEVMTWKVAGWELPDSVCCVIRVSNLKTKKVEELVYQRRKSAQKKVDQLLREPDIEFVVCDHEAIHHLTPCDE